MVILGDAGGTEEISYWLVLIAIAGTIGWVVQRLHSRHRTDRSVLNLGPRDLGPRDLGPRDLRARFIERQRIASDGTNTDRGNDQTPPTIGHADATDSRPQA